LYKSKEPIIHEFLEMDKVIRGGEIAEEDPFRTGLAGPEAVEI
jgi:hypothetical protein